MTSPKLHAQSHHSFFKTETGQVPTLYDLNSLTALLFHGCLPFKMLGFFPCEVFDPDPDPDFAPDFLDIALSSTVSWESVELASESSSSTDPATLTFDPLPPPGGGRRVGWICLL